MVINLLILLADRDLSVDQFNNTVAQIHCHLFGLIEVIGHLLFQLGHDSFDLVLGKSQIGIDLFLVNFVGLGKREHGNEAEDEKRESVEPGADVSHNPEEDSELDGVNHVFNEDEAAEFSDVGRHVGRDDFSVFLGLFR